MKSNRRFHHQSWLLVFFILFNVHTACSQTAVHPGTLKVSVSDAAENELIVWYSLSLTSLTTGNIVSAEPDLLGTASFRNLPSGLYRLKLTSVGYLPLVVDSIRVYSDSTIALSFQLKPYFGYNEYDAHDDLTKGIVRVYRSGWFLDSADTLSAKYGFRIDLISCDPRIRFDRYNAVVYKYLDSVNGPGWFERYVRELSLAKYPMDSVYKLLIK